MFVYCDKCNYDSGDRDTMKELEEKVKEDGGVFNTGNDKCPKCESLNSLRVD